MNEPKVIDDHNECCGSEEIVQFEEEEEEEYQTNVEEISYNIRKKLRKC